MTHSGGKPHITGDKGQRFMVTFDDSESPERRTFGWASTLEGALAMVACIKAHPSWNLPYIIDREPKP